MLSMLSSRMNVSRGQSIACKSWEYLRRGVGRREGKEERKEEAKEVEGEEEGGR